MTIILLLILGLLVLFWVAPGISRTGRELRELGDAIVQLGRVGFQSYREWRRGRQRQEIILWSSLAGFVAILSLFVSLTNPEPESSDREEAPSYIAEEVIRVCKEKLVRGYGGTTDTFITHQVYRTTMSDIPNVPTYLANNSETIWRAEGLIRGLFDSGSWTCWAYENPDTVTRWWVADIEWEMP